MKSLPFNRHINPYLAVLIIVIFGSVMTQIITQTADALILFAEEQELLATYLKASIVR